VTPAQVAALTQAVFEHKHIKALTFSFANIGDEGLKAIV
jgi:hypothetical protein